MNIHVNTIKCKYLKTSRETLQIKSKIVDCVRSKFISKKNVGGGVTFCTPFSSALFNNKYNENTACEDGNVYIYSTLRDFLVHVKA